MRDLELNVNRRFNELQEDLNLRRNEEVGKMQRALLTEVQAYACANGYQLIVGDKERSAGKVAVRTRGGEDLGQMDLPVFIERLRTEAVPGSAA